MMLDRLESSREKLQGEAASCDITWLNRTTNCMKAMRMEGSNAARLSRQLQLHQVTAKS